MLLKGASVLAVETTRVAPLRASPNLSARRKGRYGLSPRPSR